MSDAVTVAAIAAGASIIGGIVGGVLSPYGKDWVARKASERTAAAEALARQQATADAGRARERQLYEDLGQALETWRAVAPFVALNSAKAAAQFAAQERVRALGPQVNDALLRDRLAAIVAGDSDEFEGLHGLAVARLGEVVRESNRLP